MCPYCAVRGRQAHGGRPRDLWPAAAKIPQTRQMRASLVIHVDDRLDQAVRNRKPSVNSTDGADCGRPELADSTQVARSWRPNAMASIREVQLNGRRRLPPTTGVSELRTTDRVYSTDHCRNNVL